MSMAASQRREAFLNLLKNNHNAWRMQLLSNIMHSTDLQDQYHFEPLLRVPAGPWATRTAALPPRRDRLRAC